MDLVVGPKPAHKCNSFPKGRNSTAMRKCITKECCDEIKKYIHKALYSSPMPEYMTK